MHNGFLGSQSTTIPIITSKSPHSCLFFPLLYCNYTFHVVYVPGYFIASHISSHKSLPYMEFFVKYTPSLVET